MRQTSSFLANLLLTPSQLKNVLAFLTVLKSRDGHLRNLTKSITEKNVWDEMRQTSSFLAKLLLAPSQMKNLLAFLTVFSVLKSRDGHLRSLTKSITDKKCVGRNATNLDFFNKPAADTLPNEERFGVFDCFEVSRWPSSKLDKKITEKNV